MLGDKISTLRKERNMSQEVLTQQLNVTRQTVSKWEKGLSVPDAELLIKLCDVFQVPVNEILGINSEVRVDVKSRENAEDSDVNEGTAPEDGLTGDTTEKGKVTSYEVGEIASQLMTINEQLAVQNRRQKHILRAILIVLAVIAVIFITVFVANIARRPGLEPVTEEYYYYTCTLDGETYELTVYYENETEQYFTFGDAIFDEILKHDEDSGETPEDITREIEDYFISRGGTVEVEKTDEPIEEYKRIIKVLWGFPKFLGV